MTVPKLPVACWLALRQRLGTYAFVVVIAVCPVAARADLPSDHGIDAARVRAERLPAWGTDGRVLYSTCTFPDFVNAIAFVNRLVAPAETRGHHPDLAISYNRLEIALTTHEAGGLTELDFALAEDIADLIANAEDLSPTCKPHR
ncbi:4a-hydroxytetrahydrobiopterin dehydratase [Rubidibacter lacunae]|nr:4a-hydroxytetrahydrobiopterin dehydratase [Rubidibacter lacunae]